MNKEKIVEELNEWVKKEFGSLYSVMNDGDLTLCKNRNSIAWFRDFEKSTFRFSSNGDDCGIQLIKKGIIETFHDKAIELLEYEPKYTVQVFPSEYGFLYKRDGDINDLLVQDLDGYEDYHVNDWFTKSEIEELKKRDDVAIDWGKTVIKEVE